MRKGILFVAALLVGIVGVGTKATAQITTGNVLIDPYFGFPTSNVFLGLVSPIDRPGFRAVGPPVSFGGRVEYMLLDNLGAGFDVNYAISGYQFLIENHFDNETQTTSDVQYKYTVKKLRAMVRVNYHFVQTSEFDVYTGFGFGYRGATRSVTHDGVAQSNYPSEWTFIESPVAFRFAIGMKYYFSDNIGTFLEVGSSGGSLMQLGITVKM